MIHKRHQYTSKFKAYNAALALGLADDLEGEIIFPINAPNSTDEYISTKTTVGTLMREALEEVNEKLPTYSELQELVMLLRQATSVQLPQGESIKLTHEVINKINDLKYLASIS